MNRLSVNRIETVICCVGISVICVMVLMYFISPILLSSEPIQDKLNQYFGMWWALVYPRVLLLLAPIGCQFIVGGLLFKKNKGLYGFWCVLPSALFVIHIGGYIVQSIIASILGLTLSVYAARISGAIFGVFNSPIESFNWKEKTLTVSYEVPKIWVYIFDLLILLNALVVPIMVSKVTAENYVITGAFTFLCLVYLYSLLMLRKERLLGAYLFVILNIGIILFYAFNYQVLKIAYYIEPYFLIKKAGNLILFLGPLALIIYNRKRLIW